MSPNGAALLGGTLRLRRYQGHMLLVEGRRNDRVGRQLNPHAAQNVAIRAETHHGKHGPSAVALALIQLVLKAPAPFEE